jgi:uncharacterized protein (DUF427 family)
MAAQHRPHLVPGPDHPITVTPTGRRVVARVSGVVVADTSAALTLQESTYPAVQYLPLSDVDPSALRPSETHTYCPYKGEASYCSLSVAGTDIDLTDAVWTYPTPYPEVAEIAGHVAFYPDRVEVAVEG